MSCKITKAILRLSRFNSCFILFLAILIPIALHLDDWLHAFVYALPILTTCMNGFVINDISDIEADKINHPERPLPNKDISEFTAIIIYYGLLAFTLCYVKLFIENSVVYGYLLFLIGLINYNYVVRHTPSIKNIYIALVGTTPFLILLTLIPDFDRNIPVIIAMFFFVLGREILMDVHDEKGDGQTLAKIIGITNAQKLAFFAQFTGIALLAYASQTIFFYVIVMILAVLEGYFTLRWYQGVNKQKLIIWMRIHFLSGILFLL